MVNRTTATVVSVLLLPIHARQRSRVMMSLVFVGDLLLTMSPLCITIVPMFTKILISGLAQRVLWELRSLLCDAAPGCRSSSPLAGASSLNKGLDLGGDYVDHFSAVSGRFITHGRQAVCDIMIYE